MHMADALISPPVGGAMWLAGAGLIGYCSRKVRSSLDNETVPLMGVLGAFVFAAQMINFTIPGTGSSGHLGGGLLLAILMGPHAGLLVVSSVLVVQALFFADGGLLSLGCNIVNVGFLPCFLAYPLIYKPIAGERPGPSRLWLACIMASVVALQLGSFSVVLQTLLSGVVELPFRTFALLMQPIHLGIGIVEGLATVAVLSFVRKARPGSIGGPVPAGNRSTRTVLLGLLSAAILLGGFLSWFASQAPDGLEWAIHKTTGGEELNAGGGEPIRRRARSRTGQRSCRNTDSGRMIRISTRKIRSSRLQGRPPPCRGLSVVRQP